MSSKPPRPDACETAQAELVRLRDGSHAAIRAAVADDEPALRSLLAHLSPTSRYHRFFSGAADVSREAHLVAATGPGRFGVVAHDEDGALIGHGLCVELDGDCGEVAVEVADRMHDRGLATIILERLAMEAEGRGMARLVASVLPENHAMLDVFRDGFDAHPTQRDGVDYIEFAPSAWRTAQARFSQ